MKIMELKSDKRFERVTPPLTGEQFERLTENLLKDGIMEPLIVYKGEILEK